MQKLYDKQNTKTLSKSRTNNCVMDTTLELGTK